MTSHKRKSLDAAFANLNFARTRSKSPSKSLKMSITSTLGRSIRSTGFPAWRTLRGLSSPNPEQCNFTLKMDENYREYRRGQEKVDVVFERSAAVIEELKATFQNDDYGMHLESYVEFTADSMAHLVFGSNMQERAGMGLDETIKLCREVFEGKNIDPTEISPRSPEYAAQLEFLVTQGFEENPDAYHVIRSRREVIQHAQALKHILDAALNRDEPLTEELIRETHRILCQGIDLDTKTSLRNVQYAGLYRDTMAMAGATVFTAPEKVPAAMQRLISDFNEDIENREKHQEMDPFYLAADICQDFVMIHPFKDGNGRMCRLIANAFLMKYSGIVISIGEHDHDRKAYLEIAELAGDGETEEQARGTLAGFFLEKADRTLSKLEGKLAAVKNKQ
ncbi:hypothetical protein WAI453_003133 [Rhynchosporium graminicola]